jgi:hypothetical protein
MRPFDSRCRLGTAVVKVDNRGWSPYGAPWLQPVATARKSQGRQNGRNRRKPSLLVATSCHKQRMVRRRSPVRVRERAWGSAEVPANQMLLLPCMAPTSTSLKRRDSMRAPQTGLLETRWKRLKSAAPRWACRTFGGRFWGVLARLRCVPTSRAPRSAGVAARQTRNLL